MLNVQPAQAGRQDNFEPLHISLEADGRCLVLVDRSVYSQHHMAHVGSYRYVVFGYWIAGSQLADCDVCGEPDSMLLTAEPIDVLVLTDDRSLAVEVFRINYSALLDERPVAQRKEQAGSDPATKPPANDPGSNPGGPTIPDWPLGDFWVVSYSYETEFVATRHRGGCGVLRNARLTQDSGFGGRYGSLSVIEEARYQKSRERNPALPEPEDHTCCKHQASVASFRFAESSS